MIDNQHACVLVPGTHGEGVHLRGGVHVRMAVDWYLPLVMGAITAMHHGGAHLLYFWRDNFSYFNTKGKAIGTGQIPSGAAATGTPRHHAGSRGTFVRYIELVQK